MDADLLLLMFGAYMDHCLVPDPLAKHPTRPFSSVYLLREPTPPSFSQRLPTAFFIHQKHENQALLFEFARNGAAQVLSTPPGPENLFAALFLFLRHCDGYLGEMRLDQQGINLSGLLA